MLDVLVNHYAIYEVQFKPFLFFNFMLSFFSVLSRSYITKITSIVNSTAIFADS